MAARPLVALAVTAVVATSCASDDGKEEAQRACAVVMEGRELEAADLASQAQAKHRQWGDLYWAITVIANQPPGLPTKQLVAALRRLKTECALAED